MMALPAAGERRRLGLGRPAMVLVCRVVDLRRQVVPCHVAQDAGHEGGEPSRGGRLRVWGHGSARFDIHVGALLKLRTYGRSFRGAAEAAHLRP